MKTSSLTLLVAFAFALQAFGSDQPSTAKPLKTGSPKGKHSQVQAPPREKGAVLTGSYIHRNIHRRGVTTDGPTPLYVLDQKTIEVSGAADLSQVLIRSGFRR